MNSYQFGEFALTFHNYVAEQQHSSCPLALKQSFDRRISLLLLSMKILEELYSRLVSQWVFTFDCVSLKYEPWLDQTRLIPPKRTNKLQSVVHISNYYSYVICFVLIFNQTPLIQLYKITKTRFYISPTVLFLFFFTLASKHPQLETSAYENAENAITRNKETNCESPQQSCYFGGRQLFTSSYFFISYFAKNLSKL